MAQRYLDMPDGMHIMVDVPKERGFSKEVWLGETGVDSMVRTYNGARGSREKVYETYLYDGIGGDVAAYLDSSRLLERVHWENDETTILTPHGGQGTSLSVEYIYGGVVKYTRRMEETPFPEHHILYKVVTGLFNLPSLAGSVFEYERLLEDARQDNMRSAGGGGTVDFVRLLAYHGGIMAKVALGQWRKMGEDEKKTFTPFAVEMKVCGMDICLDALQYKNVRGEDVSKVYGLVSRRLNPSGLSGYEEGKCRLPSVDEMQVVTVAIGEVNAVMRELGCDPVDPHVWVSRAVPDIDRTRYEILLNPYCTKYPGMSAGQRMVIDYYGDIMVYTPPKPRQEKPRVREHWSFF